MRIDVYGVFLISGRTAPLEQCFKQLVRAWIAKVLRYSIVPACAVTVILADAFGADGKKQKRCAIIARSAGGRRVRVDGTGPTLREAVVAGVGRLAHAESNALPAELDVPAA